MHNQHHQSKNLLPPTAAQQHSFEAPRHVFNEKQKIFTLADAAANKHSHQSTGALQQRSSSSQSSEQREWWARLVVKVYREHASSALSERHFYQLVTGSESQQQCDDEEDGGCDVSPKLDADFLKLLCGIIPEYYGHTQDFLQPNNKAIMIQNMLHGLPMPCTMDLKVGKVNKVPVAGAKPVKCAKRKQQGFTFDGMLLNSPKMAAPLQPSEETHLIIHKEAAREKSSEEVHQIIGSFIRNADSLALTLNNDILNQLHNIRQVLADPRNRFRMFSTSLLITYNAQAREQAELMLKICLIDFEHVLIEENDQALAEGDKNIVFGIDKLIYLFTDLQSELIEELGRASALTEQNIPVNG